MNEDLSQYGTVLPEVEITSTKIDTPFYIIVLELAYIAIIVFMFIQLSLIALGK